MKIGNKWSWQIKYAWWVAWNKREINDEQFMLEVGCSPSVLKSYRWNKGLQNYWLRSIK